MTISGEFAPRAGAGPVVPVDAPRGPRSSTDELIRFVEASRTRISQALRERGAVLLRQAPVRDAAGFERLARAFARSGTLPYIGGDSPRTRVGGAVYTSTEVPPDIAIGMHNELSYLPRYPQLLFFRCEKAAPSGGESTLADGRAVLAALDPAVRARFLDLGVRYEYAFPGTGRLAALVNRYQAVSRTWMEAFETDDPREAERKCRELDLMAYWEGSSQRLRAFSVRPATLVHPETRERVWFNQAHLFELLPRAVGWTRYMQARAAFLHPDFRTHGARFGNGARIPRDVLEHVVDVLDAHTHQVALQPDDVLVVDNVLCMHGRAPFRGERRILVTMTG